MDKPPLRVTGGGGGAAGSVDSLDAGARLLGCVRAELERCVRGCVGAWEGRGGEERGGEGRKGEWLVVVW